MNTARFISIGALCLAAAPSLHAISTGRDRVTTESAHFAITVDRAKVDAAPIAAAWLENAYRRESEFFGFEIPGKTQVMLLDEEDFSNGFAVSTNRWITLYLPPARFRLRGTTNWLPDVSSHELAHIFTLLKMGITRRFMGAEAFAGWEMRKGQAQGDAAWPTDDVPPWLAEGLAQYGSMVCGFDTLDTHREMLLREAWRSGSLLPLKSMESYARDGRSSELIYNQGFHLVDFLYRNYGRDAVNAMLSSWSGLGYGGAFRAAFHASPSEVYEGWKRETDHKYAGENLSAVSPKHGWGIPYRVEDAPVLDSITGTLYFLAANANDFGMTHLYARAPNGRETLIMRDVNSPLHQALRGNLLFSSTRIMPGTGCRISDLYLYDTKTRGVERLTHGLRAIAGAQTPSGEVFAIQQNEGRSRIALIHNGKPTQWVEAPDQAEFMDITPWNDSTLLVGMVRGGNSDIYSLDTRHGTLRPVVASPHNERDAFFHDGRLYFSSDAGGDYAIYSLSLDSLSQGAPRLHSRAGSPAFSPFVSRGTLYCSVYSSDGFVLHSLPLDSGSMDTSWSQAPAHAVFPLPAIPSLRNLGHDATGIEGVGYFGVLGFARMLSRDFKIGATNNMSESFRINPCGNQGFLGGGALWSDPEQRSTLTLSVLGGACLEPEQSNTPYLPAATMEYVNRNFAPDVFLLGNYQSVQIARLQAGSMDFGTLGIFQSSMGMQFHLGNDAYDIPMLEYQGVTLDAQSSDLGILSGSGVGAGNVIGFSVIEPGMDFVNQGVQGDAEVFSFPGGADPVWVTGADLRLFTNVGRALFLQATGDALRSFGNGDHSELMGGIGGDFRVPLAWSLGSAGYRGIFFESVFLHSGYSALWSDQALSFSESNPAAALLPGKLIPALSRSEAGPAPVYARPQSQALSFGLQLKTIAPSSRLVYWSAGWQAPVDDLGNGIFSVSIAL